MGKVEEIKFKVSKDRKSVTEKVGRILRIQRIKKKSTFTLKRNIWPWKDLRHDFRGELFSSEPTLNLCCLQNDGNDSSINLLAKWIYGIIFVLFICGSDGYSHQMLFFLPCLFRCVLKYEIKQINYIMDVANCIH